MHYTIKETNKSIYEIKKSKFISLVYYIDDLVAIKKCISEVKKEYPKATHYCYAYKFNEAEKCSDDNEPSGTAGKMILEAITLNNMDSILVIVVRYFGKILLGSSLLSRTYFACANNLIKSSKQYEIHLMNKYLVTVNYDVFEKFKNYLNINNLIVINTKYNDKILIDFLTDKKFKEDFESLFLYKVKIIEKGEEEYFKEVI